MRREGGGRDRSNAGAERRPVPRTPGRVAAFHISGAPGRREPGQGVVSRDASVGGDVQAFSNRGGVVIADNTIDGNLQCKSNVPAPAGGNNTVAGNREDQCANLQPEDADGGPGAEGQLAAGGSGGGGSIGLVAATTLALVAALRRGRRASA